MIATVFVGLGSNVGNRLANLRRAVSEIVERTGAELQKESRIYETAPYRMGPGSEPFLNAAIQVGSSAAPLEFLRILGDIEQAMGRPPRGPRSGGPYSDRTIDLDILFWDRLVMDSVELTVPHPGIPERRFVLEPLHDMAPGWVHPVFGKTITELLRACEGDCAEPLDERL